MQPTDDGTLLRQYAENHSDEAFAALVARHVNLVYSVALRRVGDPHQAEEVTQAVFIILAKKAVELRHDKALSSWLFQAARLTASNFVRSETRRHRREQEAHMQSVFNESGSDAWPGIAPVLDDAVAALSENDRHAIVLRFYEGRNLREVGAALGASEDAAEKRVNRAVEKLRTYFTNRGVTVTASGLVVVISANAVQAAPIGLAAAISVAAAVAGTAVTTTATATTAIAMTTLQKTLIATAIAVGVGTGIYQAHRAAQLQERVRAIEQQHAPLAEQVRQSRQEREVTAGRLAAAQRENDQLRREAMDLPALRGKVARLTAAAEEAAKNAAAPQNSANGLMALALAEAGSSRTNAVLDELARLKELLHLSAEQEPALRNVMLKDVEHSNRLLYDAFAGKITTADQMAEERKIAADRETELRKLLTREQEAAWQTDKNERKTVYAGNSARSELSRMKKTLNLEQDQEARLYPILFDLYSRPPEDPEYGGAVRLDDPRVDQILENRLKAMATVLSPEQIELYRQRSLAEIKKETAAMKLMKALFAPSNPVSTP